MITSKMTRVILGLKRNGDYKIPKFSKCIVDYFTKDSNSVNVDVTLDNDILYLSPNKNGYKLQHSPECPIKVLSHKEVQEAGDIKEEKRNLNIGVAVSVVIESSDCHVLLTKRQSHMRSSPRVWVPPGGHLELGESLIEGGIREVKEETGLNISDGQANILCLWENVYPVMLGFGPPSNHVLVVYYHVKMSETHKKLQENIKLDMEEVESCCWLSASTVCNLFENKKIETNHKQYVIENGQMIEKDLDPNGMFYKYIWTKREPYSGTQFALRTWLQNDPSKCKWSRIIVIQFCLLMDRNVLKNSSTKTFSVYLHLSNLR